MLLDGVLIMLIKPVIAKYQTFLQLKNMRSFVVKNYEDSETFIREQH